MPSPIVNASTQATFLAAVSNVLAQVLQCYRESRAVQLELAPVAQFALFAALNTPPNFLFQEFLESAFPGYDVAPARLSEKPIQKQRQRQSQTDASRQGKGPEREDVEIVPAKTLNVRNTLVKLLLDQTLGAYVNCILFIAGMGALKGLGSAAIVDAIWTDSWPLMLAGYKLWPLVSLLSFTVVPVQHRVVFGSVVGVGWGVFLSLFARD